MGLIRGTYQGRIIDQMDQDSGEVVRCKFGKSAAKGTPQVTVLIEVTEGPRIGDQGEWVGYFSGGATDGTLRSLRTLGFVGDDLEEFPAQEPVRPFAFVVDEEEFKGKVRTKIIRIGANPVMTNAEMKQLSKEIAPKLAAIVDMEAPLGNDEPVF